MVQAIGDPQTQPMLTPSEVLEYLYCPRFTYFLNILKIPQYEERRFKVRKGRQVHEQRLQNNPHYLPKKLPVARKDVNVYLASPELGVRGIVDEVLYLKDGTLAPMDYKFTSYKKSVYRTHRIQLILYGLLIEINYHQPVKKGYLAYIRGGNKVLTVEFSKRHRQEAQRTIKDIFLIINEERYPKRTPYRMRCVDCTYKNMCVP